MRTPSVTRRVEAAAADKISSSAPYDVKGALCVLATADVPLATAPADEEDDADEPVAVVAAVAAVAVEEEEEVASRSSLVDCRGAGPSSTNESIFANSSYKYVPSRRSWRKTARMSIERRYSHAAPSPMASAMAGVPTYC